MMMTMRCGLCHRTVRYWAADLVMVVGPGHQAHLAPFACGKCGTSEFVDVSWNLPGAAELAAGLTVRRPVRQIVKWIWRDERA